MSSTIMTADKHGMFQYSNSEDRGYNSIDHNAFWKSLTSNGILLSGGELGEQLECNPVSGTMKTEVSAGNAIVEGHYMPFSSSAQ